MRPPPGIFDFLPFRNLARAATGLLLVALLAACDLTAPGPVPTTLVVTPGAVELDALQAALPLSVVIRDQAGSVLPAARVAWESEDPRVVEVDGSGRLQAVGEGESRVRARFGDAEGWATVEVRPRPAQAEISSGADQVARAGTRLPAPLRFRLLDRLDHPVAGLPVTFSTPDGGVVTPATSVTAPDGSVEVTWTLGGEPGVQSLVASAGGRTFHLVASATDAAGQIPFRIRLLPVGPVSPQVLAAAQAAVERWEPLLAGKLAPVLVRVPPGRCGPGSPALDQVVDDVLVLLSADVIDGPGGAAALAGPCFIRQDGFLPVAGRLVVDAEDVEALLALGLLDDILAHEIGHILGFGTLWGLFDLLASPSLPDQRGTDTHFTGPLARTAFEAVGGGGYPGARVPVENELGAEGVRDAHWRQTVMDHELMTPLLVPGRTNPLSRVTLGSLADLGYQVRLEAAEPYLLPSEADDAAVRAPAHPPFVLTHLNQSLPLLVLNAEGHPVHLIPARP
jgi:hypothetical protein